MNPEEDDTTLRFEILTHWDAGFEWWAVGERGATAHGHADSLVETIGALGKALGPGSGLRIGEDALAILQGLYDAEIDWGLASAARIHWSVNGGWDRPLKSGTAATLPEAVRALEMAALLLFPGPSPVGTTRR